MGVALFGSNRLMRVRISGFARGGLLLLLLLAFPWMLRGQGAAARRAHNDAREPVYQVGVGPLQQVLSLVRNYYVDEVNVDSLYAAAREKMAVKDSLAADSVQPLSEEEVLIRRLLEQLDPHSYYLTKEEAADRHQDFEGKFYGIGVSFQVFKDTVRVVQVLPNGPASRVGIRTGDYIMEVNGRRLSGVKAKSSDVMHTIRGDKGTTVKAYVLREGKRLDFIMKRDELPLRTVDSYYMLTPKIGYLHCSSFGFVTRGEIVRALGELKREGMESLIFDLSDNGGGVMNSAIAVCSDFLLRGQSIVSVRGESYPSTGFSSPHMGVYCQLPMVVVVNEFSSSASEIMAGAMQDWDRAVLVGARTFGKGLVQGVFPLENGGELSLTVARYYTPSGRSIQMPYELGHAKEYREAFVRRYVAGRQDSTDDKYFAHAKEYRTLTSGRKVYGGGGIVPDVYVERDTTHALSSRLADYERKGYMQHWVVGFVDAHRKDYLKRYATATQFVQKYTVEESTIGQFRKAMAELDGQRDTVPYSEEEKAHLRLRIKAYVGEQLHPNGTFMRVVNGEREEIVRSVEILEDWQNRGESILRPKR